VVALICPVRGCGRPLGEVGGALACEARHSFDRAKGGWVNLLGPQDKRSRDPGDAREAVLARRRTAERGLHAPLLAVLGRELAKARAGAAEPALLDVGCGDGFILDAVDPGAPWQRWGVDISREAIEIAARAYPACRWLVANADRRLPFADGSFQAITTITGPKNSAEFRRLLAPGGVLIVAVSAPDDQAELRAAVLGAAHDTDRGVRMRELFGSDFECVAEDEARQVVALDKPALADLLAGSYRGARRAARERFAVLDALTVTLSYRVMVFSSRSSSARA
jgi:23S rRNA (guanine745-N1)-methyltransferase